MIITQNEKEAILFQNQPSFYINLLSYKDFQSNFVKILNTRKPTSDFLNFKHIPKQQIKEFETSLMLNFNSNNNRCLKTPFPLLKNAEIE